MLLVVSKPKEYELEAVLCALYAKCGNSVHCHVPSEAIKAKLRKELWTILKRMLKELIVEGLIYEKRHGKGRRSYGLTKEGVRRAREICFKE